MGHSFVVGIWGEYSRKVIRRDAQANRRPTSRRISFTMLPGGIPGPECPYALPNNPGRKNTAAKATKTIQSHDPPIVDLQCRRNFRDPSSRAGMTLTFAETIPDPQPLGSAILFLYSANRRGARQWADTQRPGPFKATPAYYMLHGRYVLTALRDSLGLNENVRSSNTGQRHQTKVARPPTDPLAR